MALKYTLTFDAQMTTNNIKSAVKELLNSLNLIHLPKNIDKSLTTEIDKLENKIADFLAKASKGITSKQDHTALERDANAILTSYEKIKNKVKEVTNMSDKELLKLLPDGVAEGYNKALKALEKYDGLLEKALKKIKDVKDEQEQLKKSLNEIKAKDTISDIDFKNLKKQISDTAQSLEDLKKKRDELTSAQAVTSNWMSSRNLDTTPKFEKQKKELEELNKAIEETEKKLQELLNTERTAYKESDLIKDILKTEELIRKTKEELRNFRKEYRELLKGEGFQKIVEDVKKLTGLEFDEPIQDIEQLKSIVQNQLNGVLLLLGLKLVEVDKNLENAGNAAKDFGGKVKEDAEEFKDFDNRMRDISGLKSRIEYFFGLQNAIQLVKRAMRDAYQTVKDLDKAMTETAVVTDFSVGDMWAQLPDYTKRANELGVSTKAAYEAATLYYQLGLKTNEVIALSNETLKMARIAGLEAADATDRMTNALRGFNMELNETSALRVDDVYSQLAAKTASNVDEISTAMTKVASLANNANMEFETTAAFLALIIETTRESAETAGTALKTVVARFSEVKELYTKGDLTGLDEEGEVIDVNKIGKALRTAGVDLNKYFLGEVGLDDIFIELASKWDSLTKLLQRYIATLAAGSRQLSRFIALMSDYARTLELVGEAYNANGAAARLFEKTLESLESKLARLSNAWHEFTMGIANSTVIKAGVDALTRLLNIVNEITSGFGKLLGTAGGVITSILKLTALVGGLKGGKKLLDLGTTHSTGIFGRIARSGLSETKKVAAEEAAEAATKAAAQNGGLFLSTLKTAGPYILAIGAAAAATYVVVKKLYELTPEGLLKKVLQWKKSIEQVQDSVYLAEKELRSALEGYKSYDEAVKNATTGNERAEAIKSRNEYIKDLLEKDATYAKYISETVVNGEVVLTLDEDALSTAIDKVAEGAMRVGIANSFIGGLESLKNAQVLLEAILYVNLNNGTFSAPTYLSPNLTNSSFTSALYNSSDIALSIPGRATNIELPEEELAKYKLFDLEYKELLEEAKNSYLQGAYDFLTNSDYYKFKSDDFITDVSSVISNALANDTTGYDEIKGIISGLSREEAEILYKKYTGTSGKDLETSELKNFIASYKYAIDSYNKYGNKLSTVNSALLQAFSGRGLEDLDLLNWTGSAREIFKALGGEGRKYLDELRKLSSITGLETRLITDKIKANAENILQVKKQNKSKLYEKMLRAGISYEEVEKTNKKWVDTLSLLQISDLNQTLDNMLPVLSPEFYGATVQNAKGLLESGEFELIRDFFANFTDTILDDPIKAFGMLKDAEEAALDNPLFLTYLNNIKLLNKAILDAGNIFKEFFNTSEYEELNELLEKFIDENKKISAENILELSKSSKGLSNLLKDNTINARGLAKALTAIKLNGAPIEGFTTAILLSISETETLQDLFDRIDERIANFDRGKDYRESAKFWLGELDALQELVDDFEFGNEVTENIYDAFFGNGAYDKFIQNETDALEALQKLNEAISSMRYLLENAGYGTYETLFNNGVAGISKQWIETETGLAENFIWDIGKQTTELLVLMIEDSLGVTSDIADLALQAILGKDVNLREQLAENDYNAELLSWYDKLNGRILITEDEIEALAKKHGTTTEKILQDIKDINKNSVLLTVKWTDQDGNLLTGDSLLEEFSKIFGGLENPENPDYSGLLFDERFADVGVQNQLTLAAESAAERFKEAFSRAFKDDSLNIDVFKLLLSALGVPEATWDEIIEGIVGHLHIPVTRFFLGEGYKTADTVEDLTTLVENSVNDADFKEAADNLAGITKDLDGGIQNTLDEVRNAPGITQAFKSSTNFLEDRLNYILNKEYNLKVNVNGTSNTSNLLDKFVGVTIAGHTYSKEELAALGMASGGIVTSREFSLTGEEGPEIVWNKKGGYSYIAGANGPEFLTLYPGDQVFNAQATSRILNNSGLSDKFGSHALGPGATYITTNEVAESEVVNAVEEAAEEVTEAIEEDEPIEWRNEFDWLYNLVEDINELERKQTRLAELHERYLKDTSKTGRDLYNLTNAQLSNLYTQYNNQSAAYQLRLQQMQEQLAASGLTGYINWDEAGSKLNINYDAIEALTDKDLYDKISDMASAAEKIQSQIEEADDAMWKIEGEIQELQNRYRSAYIDLEKRVMEALVQLYQNQIDKLSDIDESINNTNESILNSLQEEIALSRLIKDNTDTENNIREMEARLAYLQRDTTGANQNEIRKLEKLLTEARDNYEDRLVDLSIDRLKLLNDDAAELRENNISLLTELLEYWQETGALWPEVASIINNGLSGDGALVTGSKLEQILQDAEGWRSMSETQREVWAEELITATNQAGAYLILLQNGLTLVGEDVTAAIGSSSLVATKYWDEGNKLGISLGIGGTLENTDLMALMLEAVEAGDYERAGMLEKLRNMKIELQGLSDIYPKTYTYSSYTAGRGEDIDSSIDYMTKALAAADAGNWSEVFRYAGMRDTKIAGDPNSLYALDESYKLLFKKWYNSTQAKRYATGGLVTGSGLAWLDGSFSSPEYVLDARQTEAFLKLANSLPEIFQNGEQGFGRDLSVEVNVNVSQISSDYDVDQLVNRIKTDIYNVASYRNVNTISRLR